MKKLISLILIFAMLSTPVLAVSFETIYPQLLKVDSDKTSQPEEVKVYLGRFKIYGYDTCASCCGKTDGVTSSGTVATVGRTVAAPSRFAFGTRLYIDGVGERTVEDRGGLASNVIDVLCENHTACYAVTGWYDVYEIVEVN